MLKKAKDFRLTEWKKILAEVNSSGMSKRAWCKANGIDERRLYYWQHRIWQTESTGPHLPAKQDLPVKASVSLPDNGFVEAANVKHFVTSWYSEIRKQYNEKLHLLVEVHP